jgi:hypothetical protein
MAEENDRAALIKYGITLIVAANIAQAIGMMIFAGGFGGIGTWAAFYIGMHVIRMALEIVALLMIPKILAAIAPSFSGQKNEMSALKLYVYAMTPAWLGMCLTFIPILGWFAAMAGGIYAIILFWKHATEAMSVPEDKKIGFVLVSILAIGVAYAIVSFIAGAIATMIFGVSLLTGSYSRHIGY